ncbi:hypothetical protein HAP93_00955 [Acidithiobacillus ferriphilus]|nr:hypothetical protein [Acidithiobacillus ferriphilus]MBU2784349.1 hypothetical protein [Acidithiobacillus ferriphilus]
MIKLTALALGLSFFAWAYSQASTDAHALVAKIHQQQQSQQQLLASVTR